MARLFINTTVFMLDSEPTTLFNRGHYTSMDLYLTEDIIHRWIFEWNHNTY